jgi:ribosomal protein S18 acetylase RimI-like enzyme
VAEHPLDRPVWSALTGPHHGRFAESSGVAVRYRPDLAPFAAVAPGTDWDTAWADLAALAGPERSVLFPGDIGPLPPGWEHRLDLPGVQLVATPRLVGAVDPEAVPLGAADVPEMLDLTARTQPGPFLPRTIEFGGFLGIRRGGALVAMAGQRLRPPGWTEVSAVCTDPAHRGQGLAARLTLAVVHAIRAHGDQPVLHAAAANTNALRLYETLGFELRGPIGFHLLRTPAAEAAA